jgi:hypothetical protein
MLAINKTIYTFVPMNEQPKPKKGRPAKEPTKVYFRRLPEIHFKKLAALLDELISNFK